MRGLPLARLRASCRACGARHRTWRRFRGARVRPVHGCPSALSSDLHGADLNGSDLRQADLTGADLTGANLNGALRGAKGIPAEVRDR
ncbi:pentapeptide repeat-containing protein [Streptomyces nojiriensis]|uniref:pentapeptide repeat-containing protein n=1 Tax=Streptomyces nojiriensis TaxID=66374 RepID=UPI001F3EF5EB|nr:pentapeptide repeat-containing protein [Streptomyces nojiriensis]